jgi:plastocyanin
VNVGDYVVFECAGYKHLPVFSPGFQDVAYLDNTLNFVGPAYAGPTNLLYDEDDDYSAGLMWAGDRYGFVAGAEGDYEMIDALHPFSEFDLTVVDDDVATSTPGEEDIRREDMIDYDIGRLPFIDIEGDAPSLSTSDGHREYSVQVGTSTIDPYASFHQFIPAHIIIDEGDTVTFWSDDDLSVRGVLVNSSGWFQESESLEDGATYLQAWNRPEGGVAYSKSYYVFPYGDADNYTLGFLSSGWLTRDGSESIPGIGFLPANFSVTFNEAGPFRIADVHAGLCPSYAGPDCRAIMRGAVYVRPEEEVDSSSGLLLPLWGIMLVLASYF